ncbi:MAG: UDP-N-acetylmuramate dehydrogenase [Lachnospiraceae bacterium]|nr:UDP-N-acetylmuramate dehydrogenase [Lachnospiraceae bacterium]
MENKMINDLVNIVGSENVVQDEPMKNHTTFKVGGPADYLVTPDTEDELAELIKYSKEHNIPYFVMGNGSNLIVKDHGIRGIVIKLFNNFSDCKVEGNRLYASAGALMSKVGRVALEHNLTGFEFGAGIPGTIGGAVVMNAGAYGGEIKDIIVSAKVLTEAGEILELSKEELNLSYRTSCIIPNNYIVLSACLELKLGNPEEIKSKMNELATARRDKQPLEYPSAGSTFKRPEGYFAGKLIMDTGLRGYRVGGAQVSDKHCGFVINAGNATASDILDLISDIRDRVEDKFGVRLETEVKVIGE